VDDGQNNAEVPFKIKYPFLVVFSLEGSMRNVLNRQKLVFLCQMIQQEQFEYGWIEE